MGKSISTLSKTMGGDTRAATEVLTTAMNQYGISTKDPMRASVEISKIMNIMASAAKEGAAELPQQKASLEQAGKCTTLPFNFLFSKAKLPFIYNNYHAEVENCLKLPFIRLKPHFL